MIINTSPNISISSKMINIRGFILGQNYDQILNQFCKTLFFPSPNYLYFQLINYQIRELYIPCSKRTETILAPIKPAPPVTITFSFQEIKLDSMFFLLKILSMLHKKPIIHAN